MIIAEKITTETITFTWSNIIEKQTTDHLKFVAELVCRELNGWNNELTTYLSGCNLVSDTTQCTTHLNYFIHFLCTVTVNTIQNKNNIIYILNSTAGI